VGDVQRERARRRRRSIEQSLLEHHTRAVIALFARLEHEQHRAGERGLPAREQTGGADQHRDVRVVTARVHGAVDLGRERQAGILAHRQRVHVGAEQERGSRPPAGEPADDRGRARPRAEVEAETVQRLEDGGLRARQGETDLGMTVDAAPQLDGVVQHALGVVQHLDKRHRADYNGGVPTNKERP
jgi:hypothetical protein